MLVVIAQYTARPGSGDQIAAVLRRHATSSAAEPGCITFTAHRSLEDADRFLLYEAYVDEAAFELHRRTEHFRDNIEGVIAAQLLERNWARYEVL